MISHRYGLQDKFFTDYTTGTGVRRGWLMDMLVSKNGRDDGIVSSYVSSRVKRRHLAGVVDSRGFNLNNTNL